MQRLALLLPLVLSSCALFEPRRANLDPREIAEPLRAVVERHDAWVAAGARPDGTPIDPLEAEVWLTTSRELVLTVEAALAASGAAATPAED
jgi:hypothetical protein